MPEKKTSFKFIHTADLHLGRNISIGDKSSSNVNSRYFRLKEELINRAFQAPVTALNNLVYASIENKVDFIVIAGDVFDSHTNSGDLYKVFKKKLFELSQNGIRVYITLGNHDRIDYLSGDSDLLLDFKNENLPEGVYVFDDKESESFEDTFCKVVVHGQSFEKQHVHDPLVKSFPKKKNNYFNIGVIHTDCKGSTSENENSNPYAPTSKALLSPLNYDYWAFGHIHLRSTPIESMPEVVYSGNPQGLSTKPSEMNEKGCVMVSVHDEDMEHSFVELDDARFLEIELNVTPKNTWGDFKDKVVEKCGDIEWENNTKLNLIKLTIAGNNSEVKRIIASSIESKNLIRETCSDNLQIIQIDTQNLKGDDTKSNFSIVEELGNQLETLEKEELLNLIFEEASNEIEKEYQKDFKAGSKETFLAETTSSKDSSDEFDDLIMTAKTVAENILNGIPHGGESL